MGEGIHCLWQPNARLVYKGVIKALAKSLSEFVQATSSNGTLASWSAKYGGLLKQRHRTVDRDGMGDYCLLNQLQTRAFAWPRVWRENFSKGALTTQSNNIITLPCKSMELHGSRQARHNVLNNIPSHIHINIPPALYQNLFHGFFLVVILIF